MATRSANAFDRDQLTAGRGLFLSPVSAPRPFSAADPHSLWPSKVPSFLRGNAGIQHRFFLFLQELGILSLQFFDLGQLLNSHIVESIFAAWWSRISASCSWRNFLE